MYTICFSIPVHEKLEVVLDQCYNIHYYNPKSAIILHFSSGFNYSGSAIKKEEFEKIVEGLGYVYINPKSVRTNLYDIIQAHLSNFNYARNEIEFSFFTLLA